jgi:hypothetical protein
MTDRIPQSRKELEIHLDEQIKFLEASAAAYDNGFDGEAKRLAVTLRVLLHDTTQSHSLLSQLGLKNKKYYDSAFEYDPRNKLTHGGLVVIAVGPPETRYVSMLDDVPSMTQKEFDEWWNQPVFVDKEKNLINRKELILALANQDGGAHIDPALDQKYAKLSRLNALGWTSGGPEGELAMGGPEKAAIRQIAHEILKTIKPGYEKKQKHDASFLVGAMRVTQGVPEDVPLILNKKVGRNKPCPCGSNKKYKKCHGRAV